MPYPNHLKEDIPMTCPNSWVVHHVKEKYSASGRYSRAEEDALNIGIEFNNSIIISFYTFLTSYCNFEL